MVSKTQVTEQSAAAKEKGEDGDEDWKKLETAAARMSDYGFNSPTYAETVAKFLLGPQRNVTPGQPGKPGAVEQPRNHFQKSSFANCCSIVIRVLKITIFDSQTMQ
jgi:hypothetical protein